MINNNFKLTELSRSDVPDLVGWFNDQGLSKYMDDSEPGKVYTQDDIFAMIEEPGNSIFFAFRDQDKIIGYASIYDLDRKHKRAEFSFLIGDKGYQGRGLGNFLVNLLCEKAKEYEIATLYCTIYSQNTPSIKSVIKAGFKQAENTGNVTENYYFKEL
jgi:[ribosomal protein S5]-alanine N-acetyltransferase